MIFIIGFIHHSFIRTPVLPPLEGISPLTEQFSIKKMVSFQNDNKPYSIFSFSTNLNRFVERKEVIH